MSKTLEILTTITGAQLEVLRDSKPYGKAYFDVESGCWRVDFYAPKDGELMFVKFIKEMLSGSDSACLDVFELYCDNLFTYSFHGIDGMYGHGFVILTPIKKKEEEASN